jgi:hypothetical protein
MPRASGVMEDRLSRMRVFDEMQQCDMCKTGLLAAARLWSMVSVLYSVFTHVRELRWFA